MSKKQPQYGCVARIIYLVYFAKISIRDNLPQLWRCMQIAEWKLVQKVVMLIKISQKNKTKQEAVSNVEINVTK